MRFSMAGLSGRPSVLPASTARLRMTRAISSPMTENVIDDADSVSADGGTVRAYACSESADAGHLSDQPGFSDVRVGSEADIDSPRIAHPLSLKAKYP